MYIVVRVVGVLKRLDSSLNISPMALTTAHGEAVCSVLLELANRALQGQHFRFEKPRVDQEKNTVEPVEELTEGYGESLELAGDLHEDDTSDDDDAAGPTPGAAAGKQRGIAGSGTSTSIASLPGFELCGNLGATEVDEASIAEWKKELDKVQSSLKQPKVDARKDWRHHLTHMRNHNKSVTESTTASKTMLERMTLEISQTLEKVDSREKYINEHFSGKIGEYKQLEDELREKKAKYEEVSGRVTELQNSLKLVVGEAEEIKLEIRDHGTAVTDAEPVMVLRKAMSELKKEIATMDIQIGVLRHMTIHASFKQKHEGFNPDRDS